jgi:hypothetical protein
MVRSTNQSLRLVRIEYYGPDTVLKCGNSWLLVTNLVSSRLVLQFQLLFYLFTVASASERAQKHGFVFIIDKSVRLRV